MKFENKGSVNYTFPEIFDLKFEVALKQNNTKGKIVYEYNAFRNFRIDEDKYEYYNRFFNKEELIKEFNLSDSEIKQLPKFDKGMLVDFETDQLNFDLNHPVDILCQDSYDGSVNLILNDNKNIPRLINSRFSQTGFNTYEIVDRKGSNDTNIYDEGESFNIDTSLYKRINNIPTLEFIGVLNYGNLKVGNYNFYFKFADADGNETDFVAESSIVSLYIGSLNNPKAIRGGIADENSNKSVEFKVSDIDTSYDYVTVYYTRNTSDTDGNIITTAHKIDNNYIVSGSTANIIINGFENITDISIDDINAQYQIVDASLTQTSCQNRLFLGNINKPEIPYKDLADIGLRIVAQLRTDADIGNLDHNYKQTEVSDLDSEGMYYNPMNIYHRVGYWNNELYRMGIVFILKDNTLSPVFNVRGHSNLSSNMEEEWTFDIPLFNENGERQYIAYNESDYRIYTDSNQTIKSQLENAKGVFSIKEPSLDENTVIGIDFKLTEELVQYTKTLAKGFFFVRQKRLPLILCQGLTIGKERESSLPVIPVNPEVYKSYINSQNNNNWNHSNCYIIERFLDDKGNLTHEFEDRLMFLNDNHVDNKSMLSPEFEIKQKEFNQLFTGSEFVIKESNVTPHTDYFTLDMSNTRHFYINKYKQASSKNTRSINITAVPDNIQYIVHDDVKYSSRAGNAEEGFRFSFVKDKQKDNKDARNLVRGAYGPYLGVDDLTGMTMYDIYIPGYNDQNLDSYIKVRCDDASPYHAISERISLEDHTNGDIEKTCYRGDCYICNYTHRMNRNFMDLSAPINDKIVDEGTWRKNYKPSKQEDLIKINTGDVNAVKLGHWVTFKVRSTYNLSLRDTDKSYPSEKGLTGIDRGFYPLQPMSAEGNYKLPESFYMNNGHNITLSEKYNFLVPDVPYIKNRFNTRILYSNIHINDAFENGYRVFKFTQYKDYPKTYGSITKLIEWFGYLICVFEHGVVMIPVNERVQTTGGKGGDVFINTSNVLPDNPKPLSDMFGSQWSDSVIKTPAGVYGVDTVAKKIWFTNGKTFKIISDFKCQNFLNENITLRERDMTPIIGVRNVKTHYNAFKNDVMFTFYDNLYGIQEIVWNLCWNELLQKWQTFYSWIPSFSENIDNIPFTFNRDTSKWIAKLGVSQEGNNIAQGIVLENVLFKEDNMRSKLSLVNRPLPEVKGNSELKIVSLDFKIERDSADTYKYFEIDKQGDDSYLVFTGDYTTFRKKPTWLVNVSCQININDYSGTDINIKQYINGWKKFLTFNSSLYKNTIAIAAKEVYDNPMLTEEQKNDKSLANLTTDFWKHGYGGIIDIKDTIKPTNWYGKQHPFEFEFVVADNPHSQKIFNNLQIISNSAEPESFHYMITGDGYQFSRNKKNIFYRQELVKHFYQYNGSSIEYDKKYLDLDYDDQIKIPGSNLHNRTTVFPLHYYGRTKNPNDIESYYDGVTKIGYNFNMLTGTEVTHVPTRDEYNLWVHSRAVDIDNPEDGRLRGNMNYQEDCWDIQINPINFVERNELKWNSKDSDGNDVKSKMPISLSNMAYVDDIESFPLSPNSLLDEYLPWQLIDRGYHFEDLDATDWTSPKKETRLRDKYIKIRVRYSGEKLSIITALRTLYTISYA